MGYPHPDYLLSQISSYQLAEWIAYSILEPFGSAREDDRAGVICSAIGNCGFSKKKDKQVLISDPQKPTRKKRVRRRPDLKDINCNLPRGGTPVTF